MSNTISISGKNSSNSRRVLKDYYEVVKGQVYVAIHKDEDGLLLYEVVEPPLTRDDEKIINTIVKYLQERIYKEPLSIYLNGRISEKEFEEDIKDAIKKLKLKIEEPVLEKYIYYIKRDVLGFGKIDPLMKDPYIEDININGPGRPVYVWHSLYEHLKTNIIFETSEELYNFIIKLSQKVGKQISSSNPILEGLLPEKARVEVVLSDVAAQGHMVNIRKFKSEPFTIIDLVLSGTLSPEAIAYLWLMLDYRRNVIIIGPTGSGKTTLLNALLYLIRPEVRIVTIEDTREIYIPHDQWVPLVSRPSMSPQIRDVTLFDLVKVSMRIRPDYVVIGEIRGEEAFALFQAFASGHAGLTTLHADSINNAIKRLLSKPMNVPLPLLTLASIFVNIQRVKVNDAVARRVVEIHELIGFNKRRPILNTVFKYNIVNDEIERASESKLFEDIAKIKFTSVKELKLELFKRKELIKAMVKYRFREPGTVFRIIRNYYLNPEGTLLKVSTGALP